MFKSGKEDKYLNDYLNMYSEHINDSKEYGYYSQLYGKIKTEYEKQISNKNMDINIEKCRLKDKAGANPDRVANEALTMVAVAISIFVNGTIVAYSISNYAHKFQLVLTVTFVSFLTIIYFIYKGAKRDNKKEKLFNLCLKVLDDIEKEQEQEKIRLKEEEQRLEEQARIEQQAHKEPDLGEILLPAAIEAAATVIKGGSALARFFKGFKKGKKNGK